MSAISTSAFRLNNINQFISDVATNSYYMFIGRPEAWTNDNSPDTPYDNYNSNYIGSWDDMIALKRVTSGNIAHGIKRYDWLSGTVYARYNDQTSAVSLTIDGYANLFDSKFYCITSDSNVYKCINNNNNSGVASTIMPTGTSASLLTTADGYVWKYMYTVSSADYQNFTTDNYIPVKYSTTTPATSGKINVIKIENGGTGYTSPTVQILGDGAGATATLTVAGGVITAVNITDGGSGYTRVRCVITGANTTPATLRAIIPPMGGHGFNPTDELGAFYALVSIQFRYDESGKFPVTNDYRRIGIIVNPYLYGTTTVATATQLSAFTKLQLDVGVTGTYQTDETILGMSSSKTGFVVAYDSTNRIITMVQTVAQILGSFTGAETITGQTSSATGVLTSITNSDVQYGSGKFIYIEQRRPINRASDQIESVVLAIKF